MILAACTFIASCLLALAFVPLLKRFAAAPLGLLDQPDNNRKLHLTAIPLVGGIAIFLSIFLTMAAVCIYGSSGYAEELFVLKPGDVRQFIGLLIGGGFLLMVGVIDDSLGLRGHQKLLGQIISIIILIAFGFSFEKVTIFGEDYNFGIFSFVIVFFWVLLVVNSINLLDGADGFASTIGIIMSLAMAVMAFNHPSGRILDALIMLALAGALAGFLRYNFPPAKAFLGDAGSMLIGFILAAIAIRCTFKQATAYAFFAPIALLAIPFIDTVAAIVRRKLTGRSIFAVDRGHLHHSLMKRGYGPRISLLWVGFLCTTTAVGATITLLNQKAEYALVSIAIVLLVMVFGRLFGSAEVELISNKAKTISRSLLRKNRQEQKDFHKSKVQLQGSRDWTEVWEELCEFSEEHSLNEITFDINLPWIHESFHATSRRNGIGKSENDEWYAEIPLLVEGKIFGRVEVKAANSSDHYEIITHLLKVTTDLEPVLRDKAGGLSVELEQSRGAEDVKSANGAVHFD